MAVTSDVLFLPSLTSERLSPTVFHSVWKIFNQNLSRRCNAFPMPRLHANESTASRERREDRVFHELLKLCYGLDENLSNSSAEEVELMADLMSAEIM